jgi:hypothetical protein
MLQVLASQCNYRIAEEYTELVARKGSLELASYI